MVSYIQVGSWLNLSFWEVLCQIQTKSPHVENMFVFLKVKSKKGLEKSARQKDNDVEDWMMKLLETRADKLTMQHAT